MSRRVAESLKEGKISPSQNLTYKLIAKRPVTLILLFHKLRIKFVLRYSSWDLLSEAYASNAWFSRLFVRICVRKYVHRVSKNVPPLICYNLDIHSSIMIIFGASVTQKVGNQNMFYFPTLPSLCFCTTCGNRKPKIAYFH